MPDVTRDFDIIERIETIIASTTIFRITAEGIAVGKLLGELKNCRAAPDVGAVELPEPFGFLETARGVTESAYSADQMQAYAREAIAADRARRDVPQAPGESVDTPEFRAILAGYVSAHMGLYSRAEREQECSVLIAHIDTYAARREQSIRHAWEAEAKLGATYKEIAWEGARRAASTTPAPRAWADRMADYYSGDGSKQVRGSDFFKDQELADWRARAASTAGVAVPDGWKLVPVEPTDEMLRVSLAVEWPALYRRALYEALDGPGTRKDTDNRLVTAKKRYAAMLAASPIPPQEGA